MNAFVTPRWGEDDEPLPRERARRSKPSAKQLAQMIEMEERNARP